MQTHTFLRFVALILFVNVSGIMQSQSVKIQISPDTVSVLKNPLNGWVIYLGRTWDEGFWEKQGYDSMPINGGGSTVRVSDFAGTCYIRTNWNMLEPEEGKYVWNDPQSRISKLFASVRKRNMRLAFRINVDSRDQGQNTPLYVKEAGAKGFQDPDNPKVWSPYPDDAVFQQKYEKFLKAFASAFDDPDKVDFIDAYGLGKWGEAHGVKYRDYSNKTKVFDWITDAYARLFKHVPLLINYHRLVGDTISWAEPHPDSKKLLESAIAKGYSIRHDAFGMTGYYQDWEKNFAKEWRFRRPIIMEGGWITGGQHRYWIDPCGEYRQNHSGDVRRGEYIESKNAHVNMMDFRTNDEIRSWFGTSFDLVRDFIKRGGYRLYPTEIIIAETAKSGQKITIHHRWRNLGFGYCPTNIPQWNQKYKACIALMDKKGKVVKKALAEDSDLSTWVIGHDGKYSTIINLKGLEKGTYIWLIGLVDTTKKNEPGLEMAVSKQQQQSGWLKVGMLRIK
ncbi:DUF4832 domain-containing protein [Bacteroidaceae bacterium HV4-6-C5C]|nr:DUF4832 domain-containing protein [Bacteroidaceae bacterium HV4-6-C5C]